MNKIDQRLKDGELVIASVGTIVYRIYRRNPQVLVGERQTEPYAGCYTAVFAGLLERTDANTLEGARREAAQETGGLQFKMTHLLGLYGPQLFRYVLKLRRGGLLAVPTEEPVDPNHSFLTVVYAAEFLAGKPRSNREVANFNFADLRDLVGKKMFAFNEAQELVDFWWLMQNEFYRGRMARFGTNSA